MGHSTYTYTICPFIEGSVSENSFEVHVDVIQCENPSQVDNLCIRNESPNCVLGDMLPLVTSNCVDTIVSLDILNITPDSPYSFI